VTFAGGCQDGHCQDADWQNPPKLVYHNIPRRSSAHVLAEGTCEVNGSENLFEWNMAVVAVAEAATMEKGKPGGKTFR